MTPREQAAYNLGIDAVRHAIMVAAVTFETHPKARETKHQAVAEAFHAFAEAARDLRLGMKPEAAPAEGMAISPIPLTPPAEGVAMTAIPLDSREAAEAQGFTGDSCTSCGAFAMKRAGTCLTCQACGSTTGCG